MIVHVKSLAKSLAFSVSFWLLTCCGFSDLASGQDLQVPANDAWNVRLVDSPTDVSLRGLSIASSDVIWACGSQGVVVVSQDGGATWQANKIKGFEELEFRSLHAIDGQTAIIASAGQPAVILKTIDSGVHWSEVYRNDSQHAFIDALVINPNQHGMAFSDPIDGRLLVIRTRDNGDTWSDVSVDRRPATERGEAGFAASNGSLALLNGQRAWIGLGGGTAGPSRLMWSSDFGDSWNIATVDPISRGPSAGIFAVVFPTTETAPGEDLRAGIALGGDYQQETTSTGNIAITSDGGKHWEAISGRPPRGFRSTGCFLSRVGYVAAGPSGCESSVDGHDWQPISDVGFHAIRVSSDGSIWGVGAKGRIGQLRILETSKGG
jgi:photosystem II stability/assembly factor-like uncharacterized protein